MKLFKYFLFHYIYIITFYPIKSNQNEINDQNLISYHLLDDKNIAITKNKIYFYNKKNLIKTNECNLLKFNTNNKYILVSQFSNDKYILILIKNILYIFGPNENLLKSLYLEMLNEWSYSDITPYKKEIDGNNLYFIITSIGSKSFIFNDCKYNLITKKTEIKKIYISANLGKSNSDISSIKCVFMSYFRNDVFTCFYIENKYIISRTFSPESNYKEILNLKYTKNITNTNLNKTHMSVKTNEDRQKVLIYIVLNGIPFWLTFDLINKFSEINQIKLNNFSVLENYGHKILYFKETHEFLFISPNINCELLISIFDNNFKIKSKNIYSLSTNNCSNLLLYSVFYDKKDYQIISESCSEVELNTLNNKRYLENDNIKCQTMSEESAKYNLCTSCNSNDNFFEADISDVGTIGDITIPEGMVECYNTETKPINFYLDSNTKYKLCYETCETCEAGGDGEENNCLTCAFNHMKRPDEPDSKNCVTKCVYSYYYTPYGYYKCNNSSNCPNDANLYIEEIKKCTDDCKKEKGYENQYGGQCYKDCPIYTTAINNICQDVNINSCVKTETQIDLETFIAGGGVNISAKTYSKEFNYTNKHVSLFYNNIYSILIYKDTNCISELNIDLPKIDFGSCYTKLQRNITTNKKLIIVLIEKSRGKGQKNAVSFYFYHPETGEKLDSENICKDEEIVIKQNIISQLNNSDSSLDIESAKYLIRQNIDIFNLSNEFYTDICYRFESPNGKDVPYQDRIHYYYPNLTLCDMGCVCQGVNFTTFESICQCKINDVMNSKFISENALIKNALGEVADLLSSSNLLVLTCFKGVFTSDTLGKSVGGFIMIGILIFEIILVIIFLVKDIKYIRKYLYNLTEYYLVYSSDKNVNGVVEKVTSLITTNEKNYKVSLKNPPKKKIKKSKLKDNILIYPNTHNKFEENSKSLKILKNESDKSLMQRNRHKKTTKATILSNNDCEEIKRRKNSALLKAKTNCGNIDIEDYLKPDLDDMEYDDAIKLDQRNFFEYFSFRLKQKQIIMETFFYKENLKPLSIKALLLLLNINLYFVINGLFFNENYIGKIYNANDDEENFFSYLSRSFNNFIYGTLVSFIINIIIDCIFIEEKKIKRIFLREKDDQLQLKYEISMNVSSIKKRYISFIFICLFICIISWYYLSCFNYVYPGVKLEWIKSSLTIIIIMQVISVLVRFLEAILRSISFQCKSEKIYKVKQLIA